MPATGTGAPAGTAPYEDWLNAHARVEAVVLVENVRGYYEVLAAAEHIGPAHRGGLGRFNPEFYRPPPRAADPIIW